MRGTTRPGTLRPARGAVEVLAHLRDTRRRNLRPSTVYQRQRVLARLRAHRHPRSILTCTTENLATWLDRPSLSPQARATETSHLKCFYRWALEEGLIRHDPAARLRRPHLPRRLPRPMPDEHMHRALFLAPDRIRPWLALAAYAGLRACEIGPLRGEDIDRERHLIRVEVGKGGGTSSVPIAPALRETVALLPLSGWCFPRGDNTLGPTPAHRVSQVANLYLHSLGIAHTLHTLRHYFGTHVYEASGGDLRVTQELMRHQSPVSTAGYTFIADTRKSDVLAML